MREYDLPVFGPLLTRAVMELFEGPEIQRRAVQLGVPIPTPAINQVVQSKVAKVRPLSAQVALMGVDGTAIRKLDEFLSAIEALGPGDVSSHQDWVNLVGRYCAPGWETNLHVNEVLTNFGFQKELGPQLRRGEQGIEMNGALRWLSKMFECYGMAGSMCDVVNLVYAMLGEAPLGRQPPPDQVVATVQRFRDLLRNGDPDMLRDLWVPSHFVMDCEMGDTMAWLLLAHVHSLRGSYVRVLAQLPVADEFDCLESQFQNLRGSDRVEVFRDPDSANGDAIKLFWRIPCLAGSCSHFWRHISPWRSMRIQPSNSNAPKRLNSPPAEWRSLKIQPSNTSCSVMPPS